MNADDPVMRAFGGAFLNHPGLRSLDRRVNPLMWTVRPVERETYAECVCEEPCSYCQCDQS